jgi:hypothetical protein
VSLGFKLTFSVLLQKNEHGSCRSSNGPALAYLWPEKWSVMDGRIFVHSALTAANIPDKWRLAPIKVNIKECGIIHLGIARGKLPWAARLFFFRCSLDLVDLSFLVIKKTLANRTLICSNKELNALRLTSRINLECYRMSSVTIQPNTG